MRIEAYQSATTSHALMNMYWLWRSEEYIGESLILLNRGCAHFIVMFGEMPPQLTRAGKTYCVNDCHGQ
jgi:hypothetical protein